MLPLVENNSFRLVDAYIAKLTRMGISSVREVFLTSVDAKEREVKPAWIFDGISALQKAWKEV